MKRAGNLYPLIAEPENLRLAFYKAAKGKQDRPEVVSYRLNLAANLTDLRAQLLSLRPIVGKYRFFTVSDPKTRVICAAGFAERVLHHAVMNICEPVLERYAIFDSYACRKGKGSRGAVERAQHFCRRYEWYLKLDIRKYFDSIGHARLLGLLARRIKDRRLLDLFRIIFDSYWVEPGKGLPIGNLISQHMANFYLGVLDHLLKEERGVRGYLRYMDDFVLFADNRMCLRQELEKLIDFLAGELGLELNGNIQLNRSDFGLPFLGYRIYPDKIRLAPGSRRRFARKARIYESRLAAGVWDAETYARHVEPLIDFTRPARAVELRRRILGLHREARTA